MDFFINLLKVLLAVVIWIGLSFALYKIQGALSKSHWVDIRYELDLSECFWATGLVEFLVIFASIILTSLQ